LHIFFLGYADLTRPFVCAQGVWDFEWRCRHCLRQYSAWQMCSCRKHSQPWWPTTSECRKQGCTNGELRFCQIMHRNECDIFPDDGIWLCCGGRARDGKGCVHPKLPTHWQPEFADVRLYDDFICSCRTTDTPLCRSVCPGHPPVPLADEDLPSEEKKCEGPTGCRHCKYCPCGDNCCEGRANEHEIMKRAAADNVAHPNIVWLAPQKMLIMSEMLKREWWHVVLSNRRRARHYKVWIVPACAPFS